MVAPLRSSRPRRTRGAWVRRAAALGACLFATVVIGGSPAHADDAADARALLLFDEGKALMARGNLPEACAKLDESLRLNPVGGTRLHLASCREKEGKTATAWAMFNEALSAARRDKRADREQFAAEHVAALAPGLMKLTITVSDAAAAIPGLEVKRDGEVVAKSLWGTAVPVDPGKHTLTASAPGMKPWEQIAEVTRPGESATSTVPNLEPDPNAKVVVAPAATPPPPPSAPPPPPMEAKAPPVLPPPAETGLSRRSWGAIAMVAGVAGVGVGSAFGILAISKKNQADKSCPGGSSGPCYADGVADSQAAVRNGNISTVAFSVGGVALAGGALLWLTAPKSGASAGSVRVVPTVGATIAGLTLTGGF
jgi:hypothetical protein